ncbi:ectonucleotide pyrophosphatase/phosphodiesterase [Phenylobacterium sp.]|uniref:alkaline phosphatase family protein n=1 Tax=Phenylobacterium sp. TaxID=1871053 RepID=UPI0025E1C775|nr:ectonucleotide pyrophosphatase/phosphodiesterase [Phenylobacterium sp.]MBX3483004.1 alkaline phosphatase family protein [Phenylobacterium sp.]MCW5759621.1 alkaline phosphatase family protein [Phenylobacterium sp.]
MLRALALVLTLLAVALAAPSAAADRPLTLLISIDGFRADYLDRGVTPVLSRLAEAGARGAMRPSFPSKTFPNHYTLVTGLRPDRNGIVENNMEDPAIPGVTFRMSNRDAVRDRRWWDGAEPIWVTAEKAGIPTAPYFWPGAEAAIHGVRPRYWVKFDMDTPNAARVDQVLAWLDLPPAKRPRFATLYFDTVDTAGHDYGPESAEVNAAVAGVDAQIGRLIEALEARGLAANLVVVADHGMAALSEARKAYMDDILPKAAYRSLAGGAFMTIYPAKGREAEVDRALIAAHEHFQCWRKAEMPGRFRYGRNPRVAPYFCLAQTGWALTTRNYRPSNPERGAHGFDPASAEMAAVFIAQGPAFRAGVRLADFNNVSVYPLLARLVGVAARPNDGELADVAPALK